MKRPFQPQFLLLLLSWFLEAGLQAQPLVSTNRPVCQYLFVVDTSFSMASRKEILRNTVYDLIYSGIDGQIRPSDTFALWTFDTEVGTEAFPPLAWSPADNKDLAAKAFEFLKSQSFERIGRLEGAVAEIMRAAGTGGPTVALLFSDGVEFIRGTSFDREINAVYRDHSLLLRQAGKPVITILTSNGGAMVDWVVTTVGEPIRIPFPANATATVESASHGNQVTTAIEKATLPASSQPLDKSSSHPKESAGVPDLAPGQARTNAAAAESEETVSTSGQLFLLPVFPGLEWVDISSDKVEANLAPPFPASRAPQKSSAKGLALPMPVSEYVARPLTLQTSIKPQRSFSTLTLASVGASLRNPSLLHLGTSSVYLAKASTTPRSVARQSQVTTNSSSRVTVPAVTSPKTNAALASQATGGQTNNTVIVTNSALNFGTSRLPTNSAINPPGSPTIVAFGQSENASQTSSAPAKLPKSSAALSRSDSKITNTGVGARVAAPPQLVQPEAPANSRGDSGARWQFWLAGAGLLGIAFLVGYHLLRRERAAAQPSFITRSIERQVK